MDSINIAYILLGGNIELREKYLKDAENEIAKHIGNIIVSSSIYETESWGFETETPFLNKLIKVETGLQPIVLLDKLLEIEKSLGRKRNVATGYSSRTLDADIIYYNSEIINSPSLTVPHPRLHLRNFVLVPLCEIAGLFIHPVFGKTSLDLFNGCSDTLKIKKYVQ